MLVEYGVSMAIFLLIPEGVMERARFRSDMTYHMNDDAQRIAWRLNAHMARTLGGMSKLYAHMGEIAQPGPMAAQYSALGEAIESVKTELKRGMRMREDLSLQVTQALDRESVKAGNVEVYQNAGSIVVEAGNGRFLAVLSDGMGSGREAAKQSERASKMAEGLIRAGFTAEGTIGALNAFLTSMDRSESFATIDICLIDLNTAKACFYKAGAVQSFIKRQNEVEVVHPGALPVGMLGEVTPSKCDVQLEDGDTIVLLSDGVMDGTEVRAEKLVVQIETLDILNPQTLADVLRESSLFDEERHADDQTVIALRIFKR
jgi:serine/threonine protein phosphatase PrpC